MKGSKTGKLLDDAKPQALWKFSMRSVWSSEAHWNVSVAPGLDPLLNEYLCATRMFRLAAGMNGAGVHVLATGDFKVVGEPRGLDGKLEVIEAALEARMAVINGVVDLDAVNPDAAADLDAAANLEAAAGLAEASAAVPLA